MIHEFVNQQSIFKVPPGALKGEAKGGGGGKGRIRRLGGSVEVPSSCSPEPHCNVMESSLVLVL